MAIDHVVVRTPDLPRTLAALEAIGLDLRRVREVGGDLRQAFYVVGGAVLEVVGPERPAGTGPARFWGLVAAVADLDAACARLGELVEPPRDAVQPGRRIAVVRREAGLGTAFALMSPR
ncbi:MAG TPA: VOC family protein [Capillimicrobium sp.]|nr:VOC family protein [Capillimicrobium sp.]